VVLGMERGGGGGEEGGGFFPAGQGQKEKE